MPDGNKLGERLRELRKKAGLTQEELAERVGVHFISVSRWENGVDVPKTLKLKKLASALGVSEAELLNGPEEAAWKLEVKILNDFEREEIDMTKGTCVSDLELTRDGAALRLAGKYEVFEDDGKFEGLISQLRAAREMVIENGRRMMALNAATA